MQSSSLCRSVLGVALCVAGHAVNAADDSDWSNSANLAFTSDYLFRGVSQSSGTAAVQGGLSLNHASGAYVSVWGSSIACANGLELDPAAGFSRAVGDLTYDLGVLHYGYPGATRQHLPFNEAYASLDWKGVKLGVAYSPEFTGKTGRALYTWLGYEVEVKGVKVSASLGRSRFADRVLAAADGYLDYKLAVAGTLGGLDVELAWAGSDLDGRECSAFIGDPDSCSGRVVATVGKSL